MISAGEKLPQPASVSHALTAAARSVAAVSDFACHYAALSIETDDGSFAAGRYGNIILADQELNLNAVIQKGTRIV